MRQRVHGAVGRVEPRRQVELLLEVDADLVGGDLGEHLSHVRRRRPPELVAVGDTDPLDFAVLGAHCVEHLDPYRLAFHEVGEAHRADRAAELAEHVGCPVGAVVVGDAHMVDAPRKVVGHIGAQQLTFVLGEQQQHDHGRGS